MGIRGLTTYIHEHLSDVLVRHKLHQRKVVIDGNNLAHVLYYECSGINAVFGGDYDKYASFVHEFFKGLEECEVEAVVVMDGGQPLDNKKLNTVRERITNQIQTNLNITPGSQYRLKVFPAMGRNVFVSTLRRMNVLVLQTDYEADLEIATLAKELGLTVLSNDSDFFMFGVPFIPLSSITCNKISVGRRKRSNQEFKYIACQHFNQAKFCQMTGVDPEHTPVLATVLGNDYLAFDHFTEFYKMLDSSGSKRTRMTSSRHTTIKNVLSWLATHRGRNVEQVLASIASHCTTKNLRSRMRASMKNYTHGYTNLIDLVSQHELIKHTENDHQRSEEGRSHHNAQSDIYLSGEMNRMETSLFCKSGKKLPAWFVSAYRTHRIPHEVADILTQQYFISPPQIEDKELPSAYLLVEPIVKTVYTLLWKSSQERLGERNPGVYIYEGVCVPGGYVLAAPPSYPHQCGVEMYDSDVIVEESSEGSVSEEEEEEETQYRSECMKEPGGVFGTRVTEVERNTSITTDSEGGNRSGLEGVCVRNKLSDHVLASSDSIRCDDNYTGVEMCGSEFIVGDSSVRSMFESEYRNKCAPQERTKDDDDGVFSTISESDCNNTITADSEGGGNTHAVMSGDGCRDYVYSLKDSERLNERSRDTLNVNKSGYEMLNVIEGMGDSLNVNKSVYGMLNVSSKIGDPLYVNVNKSNDGMLNVSKEMTDTLNDGENRNIDGMLKVIQGMDDSLNVEKSCEGKSENKSRKETLNWYLRKRSKLWIKKVTQLSNEEANSVPSLSQVELMSITERKKVFYSVLKTNTQFSLIQAVPDDLELILSFIIYWYQESASSLLDIHVLSVLVCVFMFYLIDGKVGRVRTKKAFEDEEKWRKQLLSVQSDPSYCSHGNTVELTRSQVSQEECLLAGLNMFKFHHMNEQVNDKYYNRKTVHSFSEYQACIYFMQLLNTLLDSPFPLLSIEQLWGGTFCYNIFYDLKKRKNPLTRVTELLGKGTCLEKLFVTLFRHLSETLNFTKYLEVINVGNARIAEEVKKSIGETELLKNTSSQRKKKKRRDRKRNKKLDCDSEERHDDTGKEERSEGEMCPNNNNNNTDEHER